MGSSASASLEELDESVLGRLNNNKTKQKNNFNENCELAVFGFIRKIEQYQLSESMIIPISIKLIILNFFPPIPEFKWNNKIKGDNMIIIDDITIKAELNWTSIMADFYVDPKTVDFYEWSIELKDWNRKLPDFEQPALMTGFVLYPFKKSISNLNTYLGANLNEYTTEFMINICYIDSFRLFGFSECFGSINNNNNNSLKIKFKTGDKIKLKIDFIKRNCQLYYNGIFIGVPYKNIPLQPIIPAASLHHGKIRVSQWDAGFY